MSKNSANDNDKTGRPSMCRSCGSIVGAGQSECTVCGAVTTGSAPTDRSRAVAPDRETLRFARAVLDRPYKFTITLLVANLFIFLLMWQSSGLTTSALWDFPLPVLLAYGAKLNFLINEQHQWWRFVTPMFVHVNLPHVLVNMYSLWMVGPYVEKLYGSTKFVVFWVLTGVAGVVASYLTVRPGLAGNSMGRFIFKLVDVPSAGASGALFGLVGVLFVFGIKFRHELPEGFKRAFGTGMLPIIMINLFIGYLGRGFIDNAAHLGGLVSGAMLALVVDYRRPGEKPGVAITWRVLQIAAIALVVVSFLKTAQHLGDPMPGSLIGPMIQPSQPQNSAYLNYVKAMNDAQEALVVAIQDKNTTNIDAAVQSLEAAPHLDQKADELRENLKALLIKAKKSQAAAPSPTDKHKPTQAGQSQEFIKWRKEYNQWLKTDARNFSGLNELTEEASPK